MPQRKTMVPARRAKPRTHKLVIRLTGDALKRLRLDCWMRDLGRCKQCRRKVFFEARFDGDPLAYHMAHIRSRGASGNDLLENVRTLCAECHREEHGGC